METLDAFKGLRLLQKKEGYRVSMDALLLADFINPEKGDRILDLGTGSGIIALLLGQVDFIGEIIGLEIQADLFELAQQNVKLNNLADKVRMVQGDLRRISFLFKSGEFDVVCSNPPYRKLGSGRVNPQEEKAIARHEVLCELQDVLAAGRYLVRPGGRAFFVYSSERLTYFLSSLLAYNLEPKRLRLVHQDLKSSASLVLVEAIRDGQPGLNVLPPLFIQDGAGSYTPEAARILGGLIGSNYTF